MGSIIYMEIPECRLNFGSSAVCLDLLNCSLLSDSLRRKASPAHLFMATPSPWDPRRSTCTFTTAGRHVPGVTPPEPGACSMTSRQSRPRELRLRRSWACRDERSSIVSRRSMDWGYVQLALSRSQFDPYFFPYLKCNFAVVQLFL